MFPRTELAEACKQGNLVRIQEILLDEKIDLSISRHSKQNPLYVAVKTNNLTVAEYLLAHGAVIDLKKGLKPMIKALSDGVDNELLKMMLKVLAAEKLKKNFEKTECLKLSVERNFPEVTELLVKNGAYPIRDDNLNYRVFCYVISKRNLEIVKILIEKTEDLNFPSLRNQPSLLSKAAETSCLRIMELLAAKGAKISLEKSYDLKVVSGMFKTLNGLQLVLKCLDEPDSHLVKSYLKYRFDFNACRTGDLEVAQILLKHKVDVDEAFDDVFRSGRTPLHRACYWYKVTKNLEFIELLLINNADVNKVDRDEETPIFFAIPHPEVVELLARYGANVDVQSVFKRTPLMEAYLGGFWDSFEVLLEFNANVELRDAEGNNVIHYAILESNDYVLGLLTRYRNINVDGYLNNLGSRRMNRLTNALRAGSENFAVCGSEGGLQFCPDINYFDEMVFFDV